jgi:hypothetical protein
MTTPKLAFAAALALLVLVAAGCDGDDTAAPPPATTGPEETTAPPTAETSTFAVYLLRDGEIAAFRRSVDATPAVARAAVEELLAGPTTEEAADGLATAIPEGTTLEDLAVADGVATVDLSGSFDDGGGSASLLGRVAQVVATLTQFPTIERVAFRIDGKPVTTIGGEGVVVDPPIGRKAIEEQTPQILIESPLPGDTVSSPIRLRGTANVFEATVSIEVRDETGAVVYEGFTTATSGTGTRGTFDTTVPLPDRKGPIEIVAYEASAEDGRPLHVTKVPVMLSG